MALRTSAPTRIPADTLPEAAAEQARLLAEMTPMERMRAAFDLSEATRRMTLAGLRSRHGERSEEELKERLFEICYGRPFPK